MIGAAGVGAPSCICIWLNKDITTRSCFLTIHLRFVKSCAVSTSESKDDQVTAWEQIGGVGMSGRTANTDAFPSNQE